VWWRGDNPETLAGYFPMTTKQDDLLNDFYELTDEDYNPFDDFDEAAFERWLRVGLESYLLEGKGAWAFPEAAGNIAQQDYLILGLRDTYLELSAQGRDYFRQAVAKVLASLEAQEKNVPLFEHLLFLAAELHAPEVLRVLPARVGNGFFGLTDNREGESLFSLTLLTVARLAAPREEVVDCLHALIGSQHFDSAYAGIALTALCRANDQGLVDHIARLRDALAKMFKEFNTDLEVRQQLASSVLGAVGLGRLIHALPQLKYFDSLNEYAALDNWFIEALFGGGDPPLVCIETLQRELEFYRRNQPEIKERLPDYDNFNGFMKYLQGLPDLIELLRKRRYVDMECVAKPPGFDDLNEPGSELAASFALELAPA
jgi:hypothetical protein